MKNKIAPHALKRREFPKENMEVSLKSSRVLMYSFARFQSLVAPRTNSFALRGDRAAPKSI
jgi:hypothetical protein